jgi:hypothetical protein
VTTIEINITEFDKSDDTHVEYGLEECHFDDPITTLLEFAENPGAFRQKQGKYRIILTAKQNHKVLKYLKKKDFHRERFGHPRDAQYLLAFSFGEKPDVNAELATITERIGRNFSSVKIAVQWEIADILYGRDPTFVQRIRRIDLDYGKDYITTDGVIDKFIEEIVPIHEIHEKPRVFVVAQAWHAPRCIETCNAKGLKVVGGDFSERFSPNDPQEWVRNAFSWVLKEGTRRK